MDKHAQRLAKKMVASGEISREDVVIDVGSGMGGFLIEVAKQLGASVSLTGIELSPDMHIYSEDRIAAENIGSIEIINGSAMELGRLVKSASVINSSGMLKHLPNEEARTFFQEAYRLLIPNGKFFVAELGVGASLLGKLMRKGLAAEKIRSSLDIRELLEETGFSSIREHQYAETWYPTGVAAAMGVKPDFRRGVAP